MRLLVVLPRSLSGLNVEIDTFDVTLVHDEVVLPSYLFDGSRGQWRADLIARYLGEKRDAEDRRAVRIGVAQRLRRKSGPPRVYVIEGDGYVPGYNFVFGLALPDVGTAVVFTERLRGPKLAERLSKEIAHEGGHLYGLGHCADPTCVMSFSNSVTDVDAKTPRFCQRCRTRLGSA